MSPGETIAIEKLARVLFAIVIDGPKIPQAASTNVLAVAHLLTEKLENGIIENMANCHERNSEEFRTCREGRTKRSSPAGRLTT